jgi:NAD-dependent deacetylase
MLIDYDTTIINAILHKIPNTYICPINSDIGIYLNNLIMIGASGVNIIPITTEQTPIIIDQLNKASTILESINVVMYHKYSSYNIDKLQEYIDNSKYLTIYSGAGISTPEIPDFRGTGGLYSTQFEGHSPETILSLRCLRQNPKLFFKFTKMRLGILLNKQPNKSHKFLYTLEKCGKLKTIITQNIDGLHAVAGNSNILELHGNFTFRCDSVCGQSHTISELVDKLNSSEIPLCDCGGMIRPNTVLFDERLNDEVFEKSILEMKKSDLVIVVGSSLTVMPAASLLSEINKDCKLVIINNDWTPYDRKADLVIRENCGDVFDKIKL